MSIVIVTRHPALVEYLREQEIAPPDCEVISHATVDAIRGRHVVGILPLQLAAEAACVTVVPLHMPAELRGVELTLTQVRELAGPPQAFTVTRID